MYRRITSVWSLPIAGTLLLASACNDAEIPTRTLQPDAALTSASSLPHINNANIALPTAIRVTVSADECRNHPGPRITFSGITAFGGLGVETVFSNNLTGTHEYTVDKQVEVSALAVGAEMSIPKQPVLGGVGGNPYIFVQFMDANGRAASDEMFVGRCVQGSSWKMTGPATTQASAFATYEVTNCENSPGPNISVGGGMVVAGMNARVIFRNAMNGPHENSGDVIRMVSVIPFETGFTFPKQPVLGGVGGNPWILAGFTNGDGENYGDMTLMGRCVQLNKALAG